MHQKPFKYVINAMLSRYNPRNAMRASKNRPHRIPNEAIHHHITGNLLSLSPLRIYQSIAPLNTANPTAPIAIACGPPDRAKMLPVTAPADMPLYKSLRPRRPSMQHSVIEYMAPMRPKFLALLSDVRPMSRRPSRSCSRTGRSVSVLPAGRLSAACCWERARGES